MNPGIYCLDVNGSEYLIQHGGPADLIGSNVLIYMQTGSIKWTSGTLNLSAITDINSEYNGLLLCHGPCQLCRMLTSPVIMVPLLRERSLLHARLYRLRVLLALTTTLKNQIISDTITLTGGGDT